MKQIVSFAASTELHKRLDADLLLIKPLKTLYDVAVIKFSTRKALEAFKEGHTMKITVTVPPTKEQGSYKTIVRGSYMQSYRAEVLQDYNSARAHDGLEPLRRMPRGTTYHRDKN